MRSLHILGLAGLTIFLLSMGSAVAHDTYDGTLPAGLRAIAPKANVTLNAVAWQPMGSEALLVGGQVSGGTAPGSRSVVVKYDGNDTSVLLDVEGPSLIDVAWAPDGSYALIVGDKNTVYKYEGGELANLWLSSSLIGSDGSKRPTANESYSGRHVAFKPDGSYALLTGNAILKYDGADFTLLYSSTGNFSNVVGWAPDGSHALIDMAHTYTAEENPRYAGDTFFGWIVKFVDDPKPELSFTGHIYGKYDPERLQGEQHEVMDITYAPDGSYAIIAGKDYRGATMLKYFPATNRAGYLPFEKAEGRWSDWDFRPGSGGREALVVGQLQRAIVLVTNTSTLANNTLLYASVDLWSGDWAPNGTMALVTMRGGWVVLVDMLERPTIQVVKPTNFTLAKGETNFTGTAAAGKLGVQVVGVEYSFDNVTWSSATLSDGLAPLSVNWTSPFNSTTFEDGIYNLTFRSYDGRYHSPPVAVQIHVSNAETVHTPELSVSETRSLTGILAFNWTDGATFARWMLEEARSDDFVEELRFLYFDFPASYTFTRRDDGTFFYRVRAVSPGGVIGNYSNIVTVTVFHDLDDDGFGDATEISSGSDPRNPKSTPANRDGDDCANVDDKFPDDPLRCTGNEIIPDTVKPVINSVTPKDKATVTEGRPNIVVSYSDDVGISTADVRLYLDGEDITLGSTVRGTEVAFRPRAALENGLHVGVVTIKDLGGNEATHTWTFTVKKTGTEGEPTNPTPGVDSLPLLAVAGAVALLGRSRRKA